MNEIKTETIGEAWLKSCKEIFQKGSKFKDSDKEIRELLDLLVTITKPDIKDEILEKYGDKESIKWMLSNFLEIKKVPELKNAWSYGKRILDYQGKNQLNWVIEKLKNKPETKAATIAMILPDDEPYIPCVSAMDFKIRNNNLRVTGMCRAIDFGNKVYANLLALKEIQSKIAKELKIEAGEITMYCISAHIYSQDYDKIKNIIEENEH